MSDQITPELIKFILAQQQALPPLQQNPMGNIESTPLEKLLRDLRAPSLRTNSSSNPSPLSRLVAEYLQAASGKIQVHQNNVASPLLAPGNGPSYELQQRLVQAAKVLASTHPSLAASAVQQAVSLSFQPSADESFGRQQQIAPNAQHPKLSSPFSRIPPNQRNETSTDLSVLFNNPKPRTVPSDNAFHTGFSPSIHTSPKGSSTVLLKEKCLDQSINNDDKSSSPQVWPSEPVSLLTLQTWPLKKLESYAKHLKSCNQSVPNAVNIVIEDFYAKERKRKAKRSANRKSASDSRARKIRLIEELTATNAKLRRQALILSYMPDPVAAVGIDGVIKFCSVPMERVLKRKNEDLVGSNIEDVLVPKSRAALQKLIRDMVAAERQPALRDETGSQLKGENEGEIKANNKNSRGLSTLRSEHPLALMHENVDRDDDDGFGGLTFESSGVSPTTKRGNKISKQKTTVMSFSPEKVSSLSRETTLPCGSSVSEDIEQPYEIKTKQVNKGKDQDSDKIIDDVRGASLTANNASATLSSSSLHKEHQKQKHEKQNLSEHVICRESNESLREDLMDSSPLSVTVHNKASELGIIDCSPEVAAVTLEEAPKSKEKELLLCFRPCGMNRNVARESLFSRSRSNSVLDVVSSSTSNQTDCAFESDGISSAREPSRKTLHLATMKRKQDDEESAAESLMLMSMPPDTSTSRRNKSFKQGL
ncbi:hypothetical protein HJC23_009567 [Cyclotella cryptica]|uniref:PAS domain-containing protein n=1 Tax=Cyclotella cryptica TaxID=29204 RepID=A0ABD3PJ22_9STRA